MGRKSKIDYNLLKFYFSQNLTFDEIGKKLDRNRHSIGSNIRKLGLERKTLQPANVNRKFSYAFDYFDCIDTSNKAYALGLIYSDGCNTGQGLRITLTESDAEILVKLKDELRYEGNLYYHKSRKMYSINGNGKIYETKPSCSLVIKSRELSKQLNKLGCPRRKSLILKFPDESILPKNLQRDFIRGYIDGDGGISIYKQKGKSKYTFSVAGTSEFIGELQNILIHNCSLRKTKIWTDSISKITYGGRIQVLRIRDYLYKDATLFLKRKHDKFKLIPENAG